MLLARSARRSYAIGAACKTIELSTNMSVWATHVLLHMAGTWDNYTLPALGVAAFMGVASRFSLEDAQCMGQALRFAESPAPAVPVTGAHGLVSAAGTPVMLPPALMVAIPGLEGKTGERRHGMIDWLRHHFTADWEQSRLAVSAVRKLQF